MRTGRSVYHAVSAAYANFAPSGHTRRRLDHDVSVDEFLGRVRTEFAEVSASGLVHGIVGEEGEAADEAGGNDSLGKIMLG
jgi:hypothetical protein